MGGDLVHCRFELGRGLAHAGRGEARLDQGGGQQFQVVAADARIGVLGRDDLALLGEPELAAHAPRGLGEDGLVAGAAAAAHGAAPAVEQAQAHAEFIRQGHELPRGLVELPVARQEAAVLVAVRIAEHHFLQWRGTRRQ